MTDNLTVRMIVVFMGTAALLVLAGGVWLASAERSLPDALIALGGVALGNLGTFLVSTRTGASSGEGGTVTASVDVTAPTDS